MNIRRHSLLVEMYQIQSMIVESRLDFLQDTYLPILKDVFKTNKTNEELTEYATKIFNWILSLDPTSTKKYSQWLLNLVTRKHNRIPIKNLENSDITDNLNKFTELQKYIPVELKNINKLKTLSELQEILDYYSSDIDKEDALKNTKIWYNDKKYTVLTPLNLESAYYWSRNSTWCTAYGDKKGMYPDRSDNRFLRYNVTGPLYIVIIKGEPQSVNSESVGTRLSDDSYYQFHFEVRDFKNASNKDINIVEFFKKYPDIKHIFDNLVGPKPDEIIDGYPLIYNIDKNVTIKTNTGPVSEVLMNLSLTDNIVDISSVCYHTFTKHGVEKLLEFLTSKSIKGKQNYLYFDEIYYENDSWKRSKKVGKIDGYPVYTTTFNNFIVRNKRDMVGSTILLTIILSPDNILELNSNKYYIMNEIAYMDLIEFLEGHNIKGKGDHVYYDEIYYQNNKWNMTQLIGNIGKYSLFKTINALILKSEKKYDSITVAKIAFDNKLVKYAVSSVDLTIDDIMNIADYLNNEDFIGNNNSIYFQDGMVSLFYNNDTWGTIDQVGETKITINDNLVWKIIVQPSGTIYSLIEYGNELIRGELANDTSIFTITYTNTKILENNILKDIYSHALLQLLLTDENIISWPNDSHILSEDDAVILATHRPELSPITEIYKIFGPTSNIYTKKLKNLLDTNEVDYIEFQENGILVEKYGSILKLINRIGNSTAIHIVNCLLGIKFNGIKYSEPGQNKIIDFLKSIPSETLNKFLKIIKHKYPHETINNISDLFNLIDNDDDYIELIGQSIHNGIEVGTNDNMHKLIQNEINDNPYIVPSNSKSVLDSEFEIIIPFNKINKFIEHEYENDESTFGNNLYSYGWKTIFEIEIDINSHDVKDYDSDAALQHFADKIDEMEPDDDE